MIVIYTNKNMSRLQYTMNLVFATLLKVDYEIITDKQLFINSALPKFSYCENQLDTEIHFTATDLLFETKIQQQKIELKTIANLPTFYHHYNKNAALTYDAFAMIFYLTSRYEEHTSLGRDKHGRFEAKQSLAYQNDFLKIPLVNHLALKIKSIIQEKYLNFHFPKNNFKYLPTYDIDYAWAYKNRNLKRTIGGYAKNILNGDLAEMKTRFQVQMNQKQDPFYTFEYLDKLHKKYQLSPKYFFLIGDYSEFDKNIHFENKPFQLLIKRLATEYDFGLHPSYLSNAKNEQLAIEKERLEKITNQKINQSRQHFLKLSIPETYRSLLKNGITKDYTMGYAMTTGFRASIANTHFWYDLEQEKATNLEIVPFQIMDVTLRDYMKLSPEKASLEIQLLIENTKAVDGDFCTLWHNSTLDEVWKGVYEAVFSHD
jgi:hypothetical protein